MDRVHKVEDDYRDVLERLHPARRGDPDVVEIRWMIEELRVSFFAQTLGTPTLCRRSASRRRWRSSLIMSSKSMGEGRWMRLPSATEVRVLAVLDVAVDGDGRRLGDRIDQQIDRDPAERVEPRLGHAGGWARRPRRP
ncbi:hypothetical protein BKM31_58710 [[Actinomadura] parvosata subsp. kistnae]|uniref:RNA helicase HrpA C-terminal domain-containing protein n=1 Tax=[Actinomadura] parvosata subsp. kistnae TaxID=1909395 RepID=A0A1V0AIF1_9ACTN|nr:hypothetical protein BKM31_58710 [Nonomuraea sp. ATCC 55076]